MNAIIFITLTVGLALLILPNESIESASEELQIMLNKAIWIIVLSVSAICCFIYAKLISNFRLRLLYEQSQRCGKVLMLQLIVALLSLSALSMYSLVQQYQHVNSRVQGVELSLLWKMVFSITAVAGMLQRFLASEQHDYNATVSIHVHAMKLYLFMYIPCALFTLVHVQEGYCSRYVNVYMYVSVCLSV